jgi:HAE1 family hydrophobic/amphiphilic exporter-1
MTLSEVCIRRPVFTTMLVMLPVVLGGIALSRMGVDQFPNVDFPLVIVTTARPGASVEEMETGVTKVVEEAVNTISGIDELRSNTVEGLSVVTVQFLLEKNRDVAQQEVQGKINTILSRLPNGTNTPIVDKFDIDAVPVMTVAVSGKRSIREITELADKRIKESLSGLITIVGQDFLPKDDQSEFEIAITAREGWTLQTTQRTFARIEQALAAIELPNADGQPRKVVLNTLATIGDTTGRAGKGQGDVTQGSVYVRLIDLDDRGRNGAPKFNQFQVMGIARRIMADYPDLRSSVQPSMGFSGGARNADLEYNLVGPDLDKLLEYSGNIVARLRAQAGWTDVDTSITPGKPEMRVRVDRDRAADLGVNIQTISATLGTLVGGEIVSDFKDDSMGELYDVWLRAKGVDRNNRAAVEDLTIPSTKGALVRLANVATLAEDRGPSRIERFARQRKISIYANLVDVPMDVAAATLERTARQIGMPADYSFIPAGRAKVQGESNVAFVMAFGFSLVFMYMVLAAQFESFTHPITILLAIPLTIPFALMSLIWLGEPLNIYAILGLFLLFGIVKKNGILQVDYANTLRRRAAEDPGEVPADYRGAGALPPPLPTVHATAALDYLPPDVPVASVAPRSRWLRWVGRLPQDKRTRLWAILEANRTRLRPILMTTFMLVAGMIPIALGKGAGSANRASMAKVIVGGQMLSLLLSLLVTPVAYSLLDDLSALVRRLWPRRNAQNNAADPLPERSSSSHAGVL